MGIEIPESLRWVAGTVVGADWPQGDETAMRRLADDWHRAASEVAAIGWLGDGAAHAAGAAVTGAMHESLGSTWRRTAGDLTDLARTCARLGDALDAAATDIEHAKLSIIAALTVLAVELGAAAAALVVSAGTSAAAAAAAEAATATAVRMIVRELIESLLRRAAVAALIESAVTATEGIAIESGIQWAQIVRGDRDGFDAPAVRDAAWTGAVEGLVGGGVAGAMGGRIGGALGGAAATLATTDDPTWSDLLGGAAVGAVTGVATDHATAVPSPPRAGTDPTATGR